MLGLQKTSPGFTPRRHAPRRGQPPELSNRLGFLRATLSGQASIDLGQHIQDQYLRREFLLPPGEIRLEPIDIRFLVHLRVRGAGEFLCDIQSKTNCDDLREVLEPIPKLPTLTCSRMSD